MRSILVIILNIVTVSSLYAQKVDTIKIKKKEFTFVGEWKGGDEKDSIFYVFSPDSTFLERKIKDTVRTRNGKWKYASDSVRLTFEVDTTGQKWYYIIRPDSYWIKYEKFNSNKVVFYFPRKPQGIIFVRQE